MKIKFYFIAGAMVAATVVTAFAHSGATGIVKKRMDAMSDMGKATESLTKIMRGKQAYDAETVRTHAATIRSHAGTALIELFPEGSDGHPSEALPAIWSDWDRFSDLAQRLETLAAGLEAAAPNGLMADGEMPADDMGSMMGTDGGDIMKDGGSMMGNGMMDGGMMGDEMPDPKMLTQMPADAVFNMMAQTCSSCHTDFRLEGE